MSSSVTRRIALLPDPDPPLELFRILGSIALHVALAGAFAYLLYSVEQIQEAYRVLVEQLTSSENAPGGGRSAASAFILIVSLLILSSVFYIITAHRISRVRTRCPHLA